MKKELDERLNEITNNIKILKIKKDRKKSEKGDQVILITKATVDGKEFEGSKGTGSHIRTWEKIYFLKDFDDQLIGVKKMKPKKSKYSYHQIIQKKRIKKKETIFECKITKI